jgi:nuclear transport factor 2 (NTF2) superfamily protein
MRKITEEAVKAFFEGRNFKKSNTSVVKSEDEVLFKLHGNVIAIRNSNGLFISDGGWKSNTTKERLNGILDRYRNSIKIFQKNWEWFIIYGNKVVNFDEARKSRHSFINITEDYPELFV